MTFPIKYSLKLFGVSYFATLGYIVWYIWMLAFINGGEVVVYINKFGEMYPELYTLIITLPIATLGIIIQLKELVEQ